MSLLFFASILTMYAAQFMASMQSGVDVDAAMHSGDLSPIFS
ncbi:hypothetical protein [Vibrio sp. M260112]